MRRLNGLNEDELCEAFAEAVKADEALQAWLLGKTKFVGRRARLLHEEQMLRPRKAWWRHWFTRLADGSERETDIFMVFDDDQGNRFALHIENKPNWGKFLAGQAEAYAPRALQMANQPKFLSYSESTTILICPESFQKSNSTACGHFEAVITFEEVGRYVKAFKEEANP